MGVLQAKTILITGAANGIGRACAQLASREGANLLINDFGVVKPEGVEGPKSALESLADEIRAEGGAVITNCESVTNFAAVKDMVQQAIGTFGRLDAVINPAGFLRDKMFHKMAETDWDAVLEVHLRGAFNVSRAAVEVFREQNSGSFVHFTSTTGLIGNLGQANYGAAKLGVCGLSRVLAMEGALKNIRSNAIAPFAWTQMTASIPVTDEASALRVKRFQEGMRTDQVAPLAIALCAPDAKATGQILGVRGNEIILFSQPRPVASLTRSDGWSAQAIIDQALPALSTKFTDLGASASVFAYDPV